jgi:tetratricopeptide (TPR) repeat protein
MPKLLAKPAPLKASMLAFLLLLAPEAESAPRKKPRPAAVKAVPAVPDKTPANEAFVSGDYGKAAQLYAALLASPGLPAADKEAVHLARGYAYLRLNRRDEAAADLRQALALNPTGAEAARGIFALQNASAEAKPVGTAPTQVGWGSLARLPGRSWIATTTKAVSFVHYQWSRIGVSMTFTGKDAAGNRIEGEYFLDPAGDAIRMSLAYRGKASVSDVELSPTEFIAPAPGQKGRQRQVAQLQPDGTFNLLTQKPSGKAWQTLSTATFLPATEQMIAALGWPEEPQPSKRSFLGGVVSALKEGALEGFRDGAREGFQDAVKYRVKQVTGTKECRTVAGEIVKCP